jgi:hypothetical protein
MNWLFFSFSFVFAVVTGFAIVSRGSVFRGVFGQLFQGLSGIVCFGLIGWAFWKYGWGAGLIELCVIYAGWKVGFFVLTAISRR